jgi:hypothetical protein
MGRVHRDRFPQVPLPVAAWVGDRVAGRLGAIHVAFWGAAVVTSLIEPVGLVRVLGVSGAALVAAFRVAFG